MTHTYSQSTGIYITPDGAEHQGYSGHDAGLNNPAMQDVHNVGPIPRGTWRIGTAIDHPRLGPVAMRLQWIEGPNGEAQPPNGRDGFFIHGDNQAMNHTASDGCIVLARPVRETIVAGADRRLVVMR